MIKKGRGMEGKGEGLYSIFCSIEVSEQKYMLAKEICITSKFRTFSHFWEHQIFTPQYILNINLDYL